MVLNQIESEIEMLGAHLSEQRPSLDFIVLHARNLLQLAEGMVEMAPEHLSTDREIELVRQYHAEHVH